MSSIVSVLAIDNLYLIVFFKSLTFKLFNLSKITFNIDIINLSDCYYFLNKINN